MEYKKDFKKIRRQMKFDQFARSKLLTVIIIVSIVHVIFGVWWRSYIPETVIVGDKSYVLWTRREQVEHHITEFLTNPFEKIMNNRLEVE